MKKTDDLRVQKTKRDLRAAILDLLKVKDFERITVSEICEKAMLTRMTFYKHYSDKYDLLSDSVESFKNLIVKKLPFNKEINTIEKATAYCNELINLVIDYSVEHIELLKVLQNNQLDDILVNICEKSIKNLLEEINKIKPFKWPLPMMTTFIFGGVANALSYWLYHPKIMSRNELSKAISEVLGSICKYEVIFK